MRDGTVVIDEPTERGGTNVITHKVAAKNNVAMHVRLEAQFDRRGVMLQEEIDVPFPSATLYIDLETDAEAGAVERVKRELAMLCPVSKVFRAAGVDLKEVWNVRRPT